MAPNSDTVALNPGGAAVIEAPEGAAPKPVRSLRSLALRGSAWTLAGYGTSQVLRLGSNLLLTRLLYPEAFGTAALVWLLVAGLGMFMDTGVGPSIIRSPRGDAPAFLNTAWTMQILRGALLALAAMLAAVPLARLYDEPQLASLIPVAGLTSLITALNSPALWLCARRLQVGRLTLVDGLEAGLGVDAAISLVDAVERVGHRADAVARLCWSRGPWGVRVAGALPLLSTRTYDWRVGGAVSLHL